MFNIKEFPLSSTGLLLITHNVAPDLEPKAANVVALKLNKSESVIALKASPPVIVIPSAEKLTSVSKKFSTSRVDTVPLKDIEVRLIDIDRTLVAEAVFKLNRQGDLTKIGKGYRRV